MRYVYTVYIAYIVNICYLLYISPINTDSFVKIIKNISRDKCNS